MSFPAFVSRRYVYTVSVPRSTASTWRPSGLVTIWWACGPSWSGPGGGAECVTRSLRSPSAPDGRHAWLANRGHDSLARYAVEEDGARLRLLGTVPVAGDFPRQIALSPDGDLLFAANQKSGAVALFHVDAADGGLRLAGEPFASPVAVCALPL